MGKSEQRSAKELIGEVAALGRVQQSLESLTDRQIGQLVWNDVLEEVPMVSRAWGIASEAAERLFRSTTGARYPEEALNHIERLPDCPLCGSPMLRFIGFGEPDYKKCEGCSSKFSEEQR